MVSAQCSVVVVSYMQWERCEANCARSKGKVHVHTHTPVHGAHARCTCTVHMHGAHAHAHAHARAHAHAHAHARACARRRLGCEPECIAQRTHHAAPQRGLLAAQLQRVLVHLVSRAIVGTASRRPAPHGLQVSGYSKECSSSEGCSSAKGRGSSKGRSSSKGCSTATRCAAVAPRESSACVATSSAPT